MKNFYWIKHVIVITSLTAALLSGCGMSQNNENNSSTQAVDAQSGFSVNEDEMRQIAWDSVSEVARKTVITDWQHALVEESTLEQIPLKISGINSKHVYKVIFETTQDLLLGSIGIYIDADTKKIIGHDARK
ncbi:hypothetical protein [Paenibacillus sp. LHD-38]|uniref:hypothetical protein n=1 Tax=Paenibacillus sp. LHD-38 TaxID=3072143 RepID=UPI0028103863|nr:hypothetical protein [Paenibacillus sp. LHD-38]MDQ8738239.1 hypothetical protein [Paenibacillus sp. LHD-38]